MCKVLLSYQGLYTFLFSGGKRGKSMNIDNREFQKTINLDAIIENILDNMEEHMPSFIMECENDIMGKLQDYTRIALRHNHKDITSITDNYTDDILDSISAANHKYFEIGMRVGASILSQLLDIWPDNCCGSEL